MSSPPSSPVLNRDIAHRSALEKARSRFPTLANLTYLNSGSYGLLADSVKAAFEDYLQTRLRKGADWDAWVQRTERVRFNISELLNAPPEEIAVTASASAGINAVASALDFKGGRNRILVSNYEFPTSGQIWHAQERRGAIIEHVREDDRGLIPIENFEQAIDDRTCLVAISHVCYRHGGMLSDSVIQAVAQLAHRHGAYVILDCYQAVGAQPIDLKALDVDFAVGGMLKYLLGTAGIGFLYGRGSVANNLVPTATGWFAQEDIGAMSIYENRPSRTASRFQAGTPPVPSCYAAEAGLEIILEYGIEPIASRIEELTTYAIAKFSNEGFVLATPAGKNEHGPMLALKAQDAAALVEKLLEQKIVTSCRDGNVRAGFHFYNDRGDVDRLVEVLAQNRRLLV